MNKMLTVAYEIGYWSGDEWVSYEIISAAKNELYPDCLAASLKRAQSWEMTVEHATKINCVGYITQPHLPGSTIIRPLVVGEN